MSPILFDRFGCFGKLPLSREFLVDGQAALSASGFDSWIAEALGLASMQMGAGYRTLAVQFTPVRFSWARKDLNGPTPSTTELVGILYPSRDGAGRVHPFAPLAWIEPDETSSGNLEHALELTPLFDAMEQLTERCQRAPDPTHALETIRNERTPWDLDGATKRSDIIQFFAETSIDEFRSRFSGEAPDFFQIAQALVESVTYLRGRDSKEIRLGLRVPLAQTGNAAGVEIAFWSEMIRILFRSEVAGACYFWTNELADEGAYFHYFFSTPSGAQWSAIIDPASELETMSYLERPYGGPPADRMDPSLKTALEDGQTKLARWLEIVETL